MNQPDRDRLVLLDWIDERDVPCPVCGYNLRGLRTDVCPECAAPLHLSVGSENLRTGPWLLGLVACALAAGFDGVVAIIMTIMMVRFGPPRPPMPVMMAYASFIALGLACGAGVLVLARRHPRWARHPRPTQWRWAWTIFAAVGVVHAVLGLILVPW